MDLKIMFVINEKIKSGIAEIREFCIQDLYRDYFRDGLMKNWRTRARDAITDRELHLRSAALTFYTLFGIMSFCALISWVKDFLKLPFSISGIAKSMFQDLQQSIDTLKTFGTLKLGNALSSGSGVIAIFAILLGTHFLLNNIQSAFNYIWRSKERGSRARVLVKHGSKSKTTEDRGMKLLFNLTMAMVLIIVVLLAFSMLNNTNSTGVKNVILFFFVWITIGAAFIFVPYDKGPKILPSIFSSLITTLGLTVWKIILSLPTMQATTIPYTIDGIHIIYLLFWIFWSWYLVMLGAKICSIVDKSGPYYLREEIDSLSEEYRMFLTIFVASTIFKKANNCYSDARMSFNEIRKSMFAIEGQENSNSNVFLPMPLLDSIIEDLCHRGIIARDLEFSRVKYHVNDDEQIKVEEFTIGDLIYRLLFSGNYYLKFPYHKLGLPLEANLTTSFLIAISNLATQRLIDVKADMIISNDQNGNDEDGKKMSLEMEKNKREEYNTWCNGQLETIKRGYREALKSNKYTVEELKQSILEAAEGKYAPSKEFHLDLIDEISAEVMPRENVEPSNPPSIESNKNTWFGKFKNKFHLKLGNKK